MGVRVGVAGASGFAGGELLRLILGHPDLELAAACAAGSAGRPISAVHPGLPELAETVFASTAPQALADAELVFLALPHGESAALAAALPPATAVVDLGADHRLGDPAAWVAYYGDRPHGGAWTYGLPELPGRREEVAASTRVANPGCYATAVILGLAPLVAAGLVEPEDLVAVAASGTSGAGRVASDRLSASAVLGSVSAYKTGGTHQHTPEIEQALSRAGGAPVRVSFTPMLAPMPRGILATCTARVSGPGVDTAAVRSALGSAYHGERFVRVLAPDTWPDTKVTAGTNVTVLQAAVDGHAGRAVVSVALDNLGKGAAGQAVQNANLMLGLAEHAGLSTAAVTP